ncbi:MAG: SH3-like domain-containing protein [Rickettsiales bacterium]|jgi:SH3-like domain-containing protein
MRNFASKLLIITTLLVYNFDSDASRLKERDYSASLRSSKSNVRFGPGMNYDIKYILKLKSMPIQVIAEYDNWVEIKDFENEEGWINKSLITRKRTAMVRTDEEFIELHKSHFAKSKIVARLENNVILEVDECNEVSCYIKVSSQRGWVKKSEIWGWKDKN